MRKIMRVDVFVPGNVPREFRIGDKNRDCEIVDIKTSNEQDSTLYVSLVYSDGSLVVFNGIPFMEVFDNQPSGHPDSILHQMFQPMKKEKL